MVDGRKIMKLNYFNIPTDSPKFWYKKYIKTNKENLYFDI